MTWLIITKMLMFGIPAGIMASCYFVFGLLACMLPFYPYSVLLLYIHVIYMVRVSHIRITYIGNILTI